MTLAELKDARDETATVYIHLRDEMSDEINRRVSAARKEIELDVQRKFGVQLELALEAKNKAFKAAVDAEVAQASDLAPVPVGTKLVGWAYPRFAHKGPMDAKVTGVLEVYTYSTKTPVAIRRQGFHPGTYIVRLLKKDGSPGVVVERYVNGKYKWLPEGQTPTENK